MAAGKVKEEIDSRDYIGTQLKNIFVGQLKG